MITATSISQAEFYRSFVMARNSFDPRTFGVLMDLEAFRDQMVEEFHGAFRDSLSVDELVLRPRVAMQFCDDVRRRHAYHDLPDDIILRSIMYRRKHPEG